MPYIEQKSNHMPIITIFIQYIYCVYIVYVFVYVCIFIEFFFCFGEIKFENNCIN